MAEQKPLIIVLGLSPTGLYAIRELGRAGFSVLGVTDAAACATSSRFLSHPDRYWLIREPADLLRRLLELGKSAAVPPILLPTADRYIEWLSEHYAVLAEHFTLQDSYHPDKVFDLLDKGRFYKLCAEHGVAAPGIWYPEGRAQLLALADELPFPCILKPKLIHLAVAYLKGQKVLLARDRDAFLEIVKDIPEHLDQWVIQEVIPGPESNILLFGGYFDRNSKPLETFTARKLRQYPPGFGSASLVQSESDQEIHDLSVRFLKAIGFTGVCGTEFKRDARDGQLKMIEINPRPTLWFHLSHAAGKRIVETACLDLSGQPVKKTAPQVDGVVWRYALKDLYSQLFYLWKGNTFVFPPPELSKDLGRNGKTWAVYDAEDVRPTWGEPMQFVKKLFARIW